MPNGKRVVAAAHGAHAFNRNKVKGSAPELFPVMSLVKK
jgi:hypothetical protein